MRVGGLVIASLLSSGCYNGWEGSAGNADGENPASASQGDDGDDGDDGSGDETGADDDQPPVEEHQQDSQFPRLSHRQWENTVRDLFGLDAVTGLSDAFVGDPVAGGFDNAGSGFERRRDAVGRLPKGGRIARRARHHRRRHLRPDHPARRRSGHLGSRTRVHRDLRDEGLSPAALQRRGRGPLGRVRRRRRGLYGPRSIRRWSPSDAASAAAVAGVRLSRDRRRADRQRPDQAGRLRGRVAAQLRAVELDAGRRAVPRGGAGRSRWSRGDPRARGADAARRPSPRHRPRSAPTAPQGRPLPRPQQGPRSLPAVQRRARPDDAGRGVPVHRGRRLRPEPGLHRAADLDPHLRQRRAGCVVRDHRRPRRRGLRAGGTGCDAALGPAHAPGLLDVARVSDRPRSDSSGRVHQLRAPVQRAAGGAGQRDGGRAGPDEDQPGARGRPHRRWNLRGRMPQPPHQPTRLRLRELRRDRGLPYPGQRPAGRRDGRVLLRWQPGALRQRRGVQQPPRRQQAGARLLHPPLARVHVWP